MFVWVRPEFSAIASTIFTWFFEQTLREIEDAFHVKFKSNAFYTARENHQFLFKWTRQHHNVLGTHSSRDSSRWVGWSCFDEQYCCWLLTPNMNSNFTSTDYKHCAKMCTSRQNHSNDRSNDWKCMHVVCYGYSDSRNIIASFFLFMEYNLHIFNMRRECGKWEAHIFPIDFFLSFNLTVRT